MFKTSGVYEFTDKQNVVQRIMEHLQKGKSNVFLNKYTEKDQNYPCFERANWNSLSY